MAPKNTNVEECYSSRDDRSAAWFLALLGNIGFFDFYMAHPVKGCIKLGIVIVSIVSVIFDAYGFKGVPFFLCHGFEIVFIWNVYEMFLLSRGRYRDGDGHLVKKQTKDATILFWFIIVLPIALILLLVTGFFTGYVRLPIA